MTYRVIPRSEWDASYGDGAGPAQLPASEIYVHHSVTLAPDMVLPRDDDYEAIRLLDQIGADRFGEQYGVPYTYPITPAGLIFEGHSVDQMGAHTKGHNWSARSICFVGNYEQDELTDQQIRACAWLLQHGHAQGWWSAPRITGGHRDVYATACPGQHAYDAIGRINRLAAGGPIQEDDMPLTSEDLSAIESRAYTAVAHLCMDMGNPDAQDAQSAAKWMRHGLKLPNLARAVAQGHDVSAEDIAAALAPQLSEQLLPTIREAIAEVLGEDNRDQAQAIVDKIASRLASGEEQTS